MMGLLLLMRILMQNLFSKVMAPTRSDAVCILGNSYYLFPLCFTLTEF